MKKFVLIKIVAVATLAVLTVFSSCDKNDNNNDVKLLKTLTHWNGSYSKFEYDNQNRITKYSTYNNVGNLMWATSFTYSGDDLVKIENNGSFVEFAKIGDKINVTTPYSDDTGIIFLNENGFPIRFEETEESFLNVTTFIYQNGNVVKSSFKRKNQNEEIIYEETIEYKYDNKKSPFYHCKTPKWFFVIELEDFLSVKNNVKERTINGNRIEFIYEYNSDGFPTKRTVRHGIEERIVTFEYK